MNDRIVPYYILLSVCRQIRENFGPSNNKQAAGLLQVPGTTSCSTVPQARKSQAKRQSIAKHHHSSSSSHKEQEEESTSLLIESTN